MTGAGVLVGLGSPANMPQANAIGRMVAHTTRNQGAIDVPRRVFQSLNCKLLLADRCFRSRTLHIYAHRRSLLGACLDEHPFDLSMLPQSRYVQKGFSGGPPRVDVGPSSDEELQGLYSFPPDRCVQERIIT